MKKLVYCLLSLTLCTAMLLCGCSRVPSFDYRDGQFVDKKNNVAYKPAPLCYEAVAIVSGEMAQIKDGVGLEQKLYQIKDVDPSLMISNELYEIFYAVGTTMPTLSEMAATEIYICKTESISAQLASVEESTDVAAVIDAYVNGKGCDVARVGKPQAIATYYLKFVSSTYPSLYYCLDFLKFSNDVEVIEKVDSYEDFTPSYTGATYRFEDFEYTDSNGVAQVEHNVIYNFGKGILYDRDAGRCYALGTDVIWKLVQNEA